MMFDNGHRHNEDKNSQNSNIQFKKCKIMYFTGQIRVDYQELKFKKTIKIYVLLTYKVISKIITIQAY